MKTKSETIPFRAQPELVSELMRTEKATRLKRAETIRQALFIGLPQLRNRYTPASK